MTDTPHRIILADNQGVYRAGAAKVLSMENDFRILAQCVDAESLERTLLTHRRAIVLFGSSLRMDPTMLMLSIWSRSNRGIAIVESGEHVQPYLAAKVNGLLFRSTTAAGLVEGVRRVAEGERVLPAFRPEYMSIDGDAAGARVRDCLTTKQLQIVAMIAQGCKNKVIAERLRTTEQVIKNHIQAVYNKTGMSDRLELAVFTLHHPALAAAAEFVGAEIETTATGEAIPKSARV